MGQVQSNVITSRGFSSSWSGSNTPSTDTDYLSFTISGIPTGAVINTSKLYYRIDNTANTGTKTLSFNGITGYHRQGTSNVNIGITTNGTHTVTVKFQPYGDSDGGSAVLTLYNLYVLIEYTEPASTWHLASSSVALGSNIQVVIDSYVTGRTHSWTVSFAGYSSGTRSMAAGVTTSTYAPPLTWANGIPNATSGTATVTFNTQDASGNILSTDSKSVTLTVPDSVKPTAGALSVTVNNGYSGLCLQNRSTVTVTMGAASVSYGSTIASYSISGGGYSAAASTLTTGVLQTSGTVTFTATVTDSRGRQSTAVTTTQTVTAYSPPTITSAVYSRANPSYVADPQGTYLLGGVTFTWTNLGSNSLTLVVGTKLATASTYNPIVSTTSPSSGAAMGLGAGYAVDRSYNIQYTLTDGIATAVTVGTIPTGAVYAIFDKVNQTVGYGSYPDSRKASKNFTVASDWSFYTHGSEILDLIRNTTHDRLTANGSSLFAFYDSSNGAGFQAGSGSGMQFNLQRVASDKPVTMWVNGHSQGGMIFTEGSPPPTHCLLNAWPVGSIYISISSTSPSYIFGGTWNQIPGRFLLGAGTPVANSDGSYAGGYSYAYDYRGGHEYITLTVDQMPSHTHAYRIYGSGGATTQWCFDNVSKTAVDTSEYMHATGGNQAHYNMPPFMTVYMWQRIA